MEKWKNLNNYLETNLLVTLIIIIFFLFLLFLIYKTDINLNVAVTIVLGIGVFLYFLVGIFIFDFFQEKINSKKKENKIVIEIVLKKQLKKGTRI